MFRKKHDLNLYGLAVGAAKRCQELYDGRDPHVRWASEPVEMGVRFFLKLDAVVLGELLRLFSWKPQSTASEGHRTRRIQ